MKTKLIAILLLLAMLLLSANNSPFFTSGGGTPSNAVVFPGASPVASITTTSGQLNFNAGGTNKSLVNLPTGSGTIQDGNGTAVDVTHTINAAAGQNRQLEYLSNGSLRWDIFTDTTAESGSNVGSDLRLNRFADNGSFLGRPLFIQRSTGFIGCGNNAPINPAYSFDCVGAINASLGFAYNGAAPSGHLLLGNGTEYIDAAVGTGLTGTSSTINSNALFYLTYKVSTLTLNVKSMYYKVANAATVDNIIGSASLLTCSGNPTFAMYECGTSTTCAGSPTTIGTVTITAAGTATVGTVSSGAITAGDYVAFAITSGTCSIFDMDVTAQVHAN